MPLYISISSEKPKKAADQPLYEHPPLKYSAERILQILLDPNLQQDQVCEKKPVNVTCSATFVVDTRKL